MEGRNWRTKGACIAWSALQLAALYFGGVVFNFQRKESTDGSDTWRFGQNIDGEKHLNTRVGSGRMDSADFTVAPNIYGS